MNTKKLLNIALMSFALHQSVQASTPSFTSFTPTPVVMGQKLYKYLISGQYNGLLSSNQTFQENGNVITSHASTLCVVLNNQIYDITSDNSQTFLGYAETNYLENLSRFYASSLLATSASGGSPATLFYDAYTTRAFLQSYPTLYGGYLAALGTNKAGQKNGVNSDNTINVTIYTPIYGKLAS